MVLLGDPEGCNAGVAAMQDLLDLYVSQPSLGFPRRPEDASRLLDGDRVHPRTFFAYPETRLAYRAEP